MYCKNCGAQLPDGTRFCTNCGYSQSEDGPGRPYRRGMFLFQKSQKLVFGRNSAECAIVDSVCDTNPGGCVVGNMVG